MTTPRWFMPVAVLALVWNLLGCAAYLSDVMMSPEAIAQLPPDQQALYNSRPAWAVSATAVAVWGGALGCVGLILRKRWATPLLIASVVGVVVQDLALFVLSPAAAQAGGVVYALQSLVFLVGVALVLLAQKASARGWLS